MTAGTRDPAEARVHAGQGCPWVVVRWAFLRAPSLRPCFLLQASDAWPGEPRAASARVRQPWPSFWRGPCASLSLVAEAPSTLPLPRLACDAPGPGQCGPGHLVTRRVPSTGGSAVGRSAGRSPLRPGSPPTAAVAIPPRTRLHTHTVGTTSVNYECIVLARTKNDDLGTT